MKKIFSLLLLTIIVISSLYSAESFLAESLYFDENFVEIVGNEVKNKRCNIKHLEPVDETVEVSDDIEAVKEALANL